MDKIEMIRVCELHPHPQNPRKDLGDLTELIDSIRANGVLQNLTVVPRYVYGEITGERLKSGYTVIIGHRRLAAAKAAGLDRLPCVVVEMSEEEQFNTMMVENMQRSDLTTIEQADGFQYMLDLGESMDDITKSTGFSKSTINRRLKLRELDRNKLQEAEGRGGTISDYMELFKIEDAGARNRVLETIGTNDFRNMLARTYTQQEEEKNKDEILKVLNTFATEISPAERWRTGYIKTGSYDYDAKEHSPVKVPEDAGDAQYYYCVAYGAVDLFVKRQQETENGADNEQDRVAEEYAQWFKAKEEELSSMLERHENLRKDFWSKISERKLEQCENQRALITFAAQLFSGYSSAEKRCIYDMSKFLKDLYGWEKDPEKVSAGDREEYMVQIEREPLRCLLFELVSQLEVRGAMYALNCDEYVGFKQRTISRFKSPTNKSDHKKLAELYLLLESIGYETSEEERSVLDGSYFEHINDGAPEMPELG